MQVLQSARYSVLTEMSAAERSHWFYAKAQAVVPHIDTLYYSVSIAGDEPDSQDAGLKELLKVLFALKQQKLANMGEDILFCNLSVQSTGFSIYEYRLNLNETFDIFIGKYLPNPSTPRIVVQLRSRSLVLDTVSGSILKSFEYVNRILAAFGLEVGDIRENRIDYAYHTNLIQNPYRFLRTTVCSPISKPKWASGKRCSGSGRISDWTISLWATGGQTTSFSGATTSRRK